MKRPAIFKHFSISTIKRLNNTLQLFSWDHLIVCFIVAFFGIALGAIFRWFAMFNVVNTAFEDFSITDLYFEIRRGNPTDDKHYNGEYNKNIAIVDISSIISRDTIAQVITDINSCQPKLLMVDVIFEQPNFDPADDAKLLSTFAEKGNFILSCKLTNYTQDNDQFHSCIHSFFDSQLSNNVSAYCNIPQNSPGGCIRKTTSSQWLNDSVMFSLPYLAACYYMGQKPIIENNRERTIMFDDTRVKVIEGRDVMQYSDYLHGKIVILGTENEEADMHITPIGKISGTQVIAYSTLTYIEHGDVRTMSKAGSLLVAFLICYFAAWVGYIIMRKHPLWASQITKLFNFLLAALLVWAAFLLFISFDYYINLLYQLLGIALVEEIRELYHSTIKWLCRKTRWKFIRKSIYA